MEDDIQALVEIIERSIYVRVAQVMSGSAVEGESRLRGDEAAIKKQVGWRWKEASRQFVVRGVTYEPAIIPGACLLPYRRRQHLAVQHDSLLRLIEVIDRIRVPLLEVLATDEIDAVCASDEGRKLGRSLLMALAMYDLPLIASIAEEQASVRVALTDVLRLTRAEVKAIADMNRSDWDALALGDHRFTRFNPNYASR